MSIRPLSVAGLAALGLLAACAPTSGPTGINCTDTQLDRATPSLALPGSDAVWAITNTGPATVILRTPADPALAAPFPPKPDDTAALFVGDDRYSYRLDLEPNGTSAQIRICQPTP